jgi:hypothetical protein
MTAAHQILTVKRAFKIALALPAMLAVFAIAGAHPARAESGLLFKQFSARYGSVTCMATHHNFRMDASELRVLVKPPFTKVQFYNMASKACYTGDLDVIARDVNWHEMSKEDIKAHVKERVVEIGNDRIQDYALKQYNIEHYFPKKPTETVLEFWTSRDKTLPHELDEMCCKLSGLPLRYGFPFKLYQFRTRFKRNGEPYILHYRVLDTTKIVNQDFPDTTFAVPAGFKPVKDLMALMMGDN